jgi:hypothetical protein
MIPIFVDGPAVEPVPLAEMKAYLRVDDDDSAQDQVIAGLVKAARLTVEGASRRVLVEQRWRVALDRWPQDRTVLLPLSPLISVESIKVFDAKGAAASIAAGAIDSDRFSDPPRCRRACGSPSRSWWPIGSRTGATWRASRSCRRKPSPSWLRSAGRGSDGRNGHSPPLMVVGARPFRRHPGAAQRSPGSITADGRG